MNLVRSENVSRQVATEQFTWLVGRFFPNAAERELQLISDFTSWLFWHDDVCDETTLGEDPTGLRRQFEALLGVLTRRHPVRPGNAFDAALADLRDRFEAAAPSLAWFRRFVTAVEEYFDACCWEAENRDSGATPSVNVFIGMRRFAGGMYIYLEFVEFVLGRELPLVARSHRDVQRLAQITNNVASWHNDLFSLRKELAYGDVHNLVVVLARENELDLEDAARVAAEYCDREVNAFISLRARLPSFGPAVDAVLGDYIDGLTALMRGNLDWSLATQRYHRAFEPVEKAPLGVAAAGRG
jgi:hypothetical protein